MGCSPPILAVIIVAVLISIVASLAGGFMMYFEGLSSLEDAVRDTSKGEVQTLDLQLEAVMAHTADLNTQMKTFFFNQERMNGLDPEVWGNVTRNFVFALIKSNKHMYGGGVVLVPWDVTNSSAFSASAWGNPNRDGGKYFVYGLYANHLPSSFFVVDNSTSPATLQRMGVHTSIVHNVTGELLHYAYQWDGKMYVTTVLGDFNPRLGGKPSLPLWEALPNTGYQPPVAERWRNPSAWRTNDGFAFTYTANDMVFEPPAHPHPWSTYRAVLIYNAVRFESWSEVVAQYAARHPDTTVVIVDPASEVIVASTTGHQMVAQDCLAQLSGRLNPCPTKMYNMSQAVQGAFRRTRGAQSGSFSTMELDGEQYFVRRYDLDFKGYRMLWLRPTSAVQGKVRDALSLLIIFAVIVIVLNLLITVSEVIFVAVPLQRLSLATQLVGVLETEQASDTIAHYRQAAVMVKEMRGLVDGMLETIQRLDSYKAFMPESVLPQQCDHDVESSQSSSPRSKGSRATSKTSIASSVSALQAAMPNRVECHLASKSVTLLLVNVSQWWSAVSNEGEHTILSVHGALIAMVTGQVTTCGGVMDSFSGDRFLFGFNTVKPKSDAPVNAASAVFALHNQDSHTRFSCAISSGKAKVGNTGTKTVRRFAILSPLLAWVTQLEVFANSHSHLCVTDDKTASRLNGFSLKVVHALLFRKLSAMIPVVTVVGTVAVETGEWMYEMDQQEAEGHTLSSAANRFALTVIQGTSGDNMPPDTDAVFATPNEFLPLELVFNSCTTDDVQGIMKGR
eukprot:TRINITY_DN3578_c0_g1_i3.p1 TRINITY_DN3578_c0_g1~~TRINITY_DN3578_c0_g1_i3.p1  ORF type:complete len:789 (+),score=315.46 TRINITY_DN3578_c0_g1_i3:87-2453(+)